MNGYKHAVTTAKSRLLIVERYESGWVQQEIARSLGISWRAGVRKANLGCMIGHAGRDAPQ